MAMMAILRISTGDACPRLVAAALATMLPAPVLAQAVPLLAMPAEAAGWTARADLALASPTIVRATLIRARRLSGRAAADVPAGEARWLMEAALSGALKAPGLLPARAEWIWQGPAGRRAPLEKGADLLLFLSAPGSGPSPEVAQYRLVAPAAQQRWSVQTEADVRAVLAEAAKGGGGLARQVEGAFHAAGAVAGASESQFFVALQDGGRVALVVTRSPGARVRVAAASGDMIGAAAPVAPRTLLWRALACGLPAEPPAAAQAEPELRADYAAIVSALGPCGTRGLP